MRGGGEQGKGKEGRRWVSGWCRTLAHAIKNDCDGVVDCGGGPVQVVSASMQKVLSEAAVWSCASTALAMSGG